MKKIYFLLFVTVALLGNKAFASYTLSGFGTSGVNGIYNETGTTVNGYPSYTNGSFYIYYHSGPSSWVIDDNTSAGYYNELYYYDASASGPSIALESIVWTNSSGALGVLTPGVTPVVTSGAAAVPVSPWSIVVGMLLIALFSIYRVHKKRRLALKN